MCAGRSPGCLALLACPGRGGRHAQLRRRRCREARRCGRITPRTTLRCGDLLSAMSSAWLATTSSGRPRCSAVAAPPTAPPSPAPPPVLAVVATAPPAVASVPAAREGERRGQADVGGTLEGRCRRGGVRRAGRRAPTEGHGRHRPAHRSSWHPGQGHRAGRVHQNDCIPSGRDGREDEAPVSRYRCARHLSPSRILQDDHSPRRTEHLRKLAPEGPRRLSRRGKGSESQTNRREGTDHEAHRHLRQDVILVRVRRPCQH